MPPPAQQPGRAPKRTKRTDEPADASETSSIAPLVSYLERLDGYWWCNHFHIFCKNTIWHNLSTKLVPTNDFIQKR